MYLFILYYCLCIEISDSFQLNRHYRALKISVEERDGKDVEIDDPHSNVGGVGAAATSATINSSLSSKFAIRVYDNAGFVIRDVPISQFRRELSHLQQQRDAILRRQLSPISEAERAHMTTEAAQTAQLVSINLKAALLDTMHQTDLLAQQIEIMKAKQIKHAN